jgi:hypothetical protein
MNAIPMKKTALALALAGVMVSGLLLTGCIEGGGSSAAISDSAQTASAASLSVEASFPSGASAALFEGGDNGTNTIVVNVFQGDNIYCTSSCTPNAQLILTPANPSGIATGLVEGPVKIVVLQKNNNGTPDNLADDTLFEKLVIPGELARGENDFTATMVRGSWTLASAINLNKTLANSGESISGFALLPMNEQNSYDFWDMNPYQALIKGTNLPGNCTWQETDFNYDYVCASNDQTSFLGELYYLLGFSGSSDDRNIAALSNYEDIPLTPDGDRPRYAFLMDNVDDISYYDDYYDDYGGYGGSDDYNETFTATLNGVDVTDEIMAIPGTRPTSGSTIAGTMIEIEERVPEVETELCYTDSARTTLYTGIDSQGTCPWNSQQATAVSVSKASAAIVKQAKRKAIMKALNAKTSGPRKAAPDANGCYINLQINGSETWETSWWNGSTSVPIYVSSTWDESLDACLHSFTANGVSITADDVTAITTWGSSNINVGVSKVTR